MRFQQMAKDAMEKIYTRGHIPILVGGTGFYIQAVTRDIDFTQAEQDDGYRAGLEATVQGGHKSVCLLLFAFSHFLCNYSI